MANTRSGSPRPSQGPCKTRMQSKSNQATRRSPLIPEMPTSKRTDAAKCADSTHLEGFTCPAKRYQCKSYHKFGHFTSLCFMKCQQKQAYHKSHKPKAHQLAACTIQAYDSPSESEFLDNSFCLQLQIKHVQAQSKIEEKPACLITNLLYRLKLQENRNLYLRARLDTCADVNIMPASAY